MENFWKGACAPRERSSPEAGRVPMPGKLPHRELFILGVPRGSCRISESWTKLGLKGQKTEKAALFNKILANRIQQYVKSSYSMIKLGLFQGCKDSSIYANQSM